MDDNNNISSLLSRRDAGRGEGVRAEVPHYLKPCGLHGTDAQVGWAVCRKTANGDKDNLKNQQSTK